MKNLTSILSCCRGPKCVSSNSCTKALSQVSLILVTRPLNHLLTSKQLIDILYNEMKSLNCTLNCCRGLKCVSCNKGTKALSQVSHILITRPSNHLLTNKQLIDIQYNEMKSLNSIFSWCNGVKIIVLRKD